MLAVEGWTAFCGKISNSILEAGGGRPFKGVHGLPILKLLEKFFFFC